MNNSLTGVSVSPFHRDIPIAQTAGHMNGDLQLKREIESVDEVPKPKPKRQKSTRSNQIDKVWTHEDVEALLRLWQEHEFLYQRKHEFYRDHEERVQALDSIAKHFDTNVEEVKKKMNSLQSYFCQLRSLSRSTPPAKRKRITWIWYDRMKFLASDLESDLANEKDFDEEFRQKRTTAKPKKKTIASLERETNAVEKETRAVPTDTPSQHPVVQREETETDDDLFVKIIISKLKKLKDGDEKEDLKLQILQKINMLQKEQRY